MRENEEILKRFRVSFEDVNDVKLTDMALMGEGIQSILEEINKVGYSKEELTRTKDILWDIQDKISNDAKVIEYLKTTEDNANDVKNNIEKLINKLINRQKDVSNGAASKSDIEKSYDNVLIGIRIIAEILSDACAVGDEEKSGDRLEKEMIQGSLKMIADASKVCMSGCKDMIETLLTSFGDKIEKKFEGVLEVDSNQDKLNKILKKIFYEARQNISRRIIGEFTKKMGFVGDPHDKSLCNQVLNDSYKLNVPNIDVVDTFYTEEKKQQVKNKFLNFMLTKYNDLELVVYNKACEIFYDKFQENKELFGYLFDWAKSYVYRNELLGKVEDVSSFMSEYVMTGKYDEIPRYVALEEVMRDKGFVEIKSSRHKISRDEIFRVMHDSKTQEEINAIGMYGETMLMCALRFCAYNLAEYFIDRGIDVNKRDDRGQSALWYALCYDAPVGIINKLLALSDISSDIHKKSEKGRTILMYALKLGVSKEIIKMLIDEGAKVNEKDNHGNTVLVYALIRSSREMIKMLIDLGAEVNEKNNQGKTVIMHALEMKKSKEIIKMLIDEGAKVNEKDNQDKTVLMYAVSLKAPIEVIEELLESGAEVYENLMEDLIYAQYKIEDIELILRRKEIRENMMRALSRGKIKEICNKNVDLLIRVINYCFNYDLLNNDDFVKNGQVAKTKLMYTLDYDLTKDILEELIRREIALQKEHGRDVMKLDIINEENYNGVTVVKEAFLKGKVDIVKILIDAGAKVNKEDYKKVEKLKIIEISQEKLQQDLLKIVDMIQIKTGEIIQKERERQVLQRVMQLLDLQEEERPDHQGQLIEIMRVLQQDEEHIEREREIEENIPQENIGRMGRDIG